MEVTMKFVEALAFAADAHAGQLRKGNSSPYICHPMAVASLVMEFGGSEELAIAALLHDVIEDCDPVYAASIQDVFGGLVFSIVTQLTDGAPGTDGEKAPWRERKEAYIAKLKNASPHVLLIKACDAIHNLTAILRDVRNSGPAALEKFTGGVEGTLWYYREIADCCRFVAPGPELIALVSRLDSSLVYHETSRTAN